MAGGDLGGDVDQRSGEPAQAAQPGIRGQASLLVCPEGGFRGIVAMAVQARHRIKHAVAHSQELAADVLIAGAVLQVGGAAGVEHLRHVEAVQPDLVGVDLLVPEVALVGAGLTLQLTAQGIDGAAVLLLAGEAVHIKENSAFADVVQVVVGLLVTAKAAILEHVVIQEVLREGIIALLAGDAVQGQKGDHHAAVDVIPAVDLAFLDFLDVPQGLVRRGFSHHALHIALDHVHLMYLPEDLLQTVYHKIGQKGMGKTQNAVLVENPRMCYNNLYPMMQGGPAHAHVRL